MYCDTLDPFVALAAAAAVTRTLRLGTGVCLVTQRDPIHTAKEVASLDRVSSGRFLLGVANPRGRGLPRGGSAGPPVRRRPDAHRGTERGPRPPGRGVPADVPRSGTAPLEVSIYDVAGKPEAVASCREMGAEQVVLALPPASRDEILPRLDRHAELMRTIG